MIFEWPWLATPLASSWATNHSPSWVTLIVSASGKSSD
jgi:hypothetical protein